MNERQISYFIAVAEEKNIGRASARVPLSPSALARQIILLEEELGAELFVRTRSGVELTPAGEVYLRHAYQLRARLEQIEEDVRSAAQTSARKLNIGIIGSGKIGIPFQILAKFAMEYPDIQTVLHQIPFRQQQVQALQQGKILAAFNSGFSKSSELSVEVVCREPLCAVLSERHPLALKSSICLADLQDCKIVGAREISTREQLGSSISVEEIFRLYNFQPSIEYRTSDLFSFLGMVACGLGAAFLPSSLQELKFPGVVFKSVMTNPELTVDFECAFLKNEPSLQLTALLDIVRRYRATNPGFLSSQEPG